MPKHKGVTGKETEAYSGRMKGSYSKAYGKPGKKSPSAKVSPFYDCNKSQPKPKSPHRNNNMRAK